MGRKIFIFAVACICYVLLNVDCQAELVTVEVTGVVDTITVDGGFGFDGSVAIGSVMSGYFRYDSEAVDQGLSEYTGLYSVISVSLSVGNYTFGDDLLGAEEPFFRVGVVDPTYWVESPDSRFDGTIYIDGTPTGWDEVEFEMTDIILLSLWTSSIGIIVDDSLPTSFPLISEFDLRRQWGVGFGRTGIDGGGGFGFGGELTSIRVIPEPVSVLLMGIGGLAIRRRK